MNAPNIQESRNLLDRIKTIRATEKSKTEPLVHVVFEESVAVESCKHLDSFDGF